MERLMQAERAAAATKNPGHAGDAKHAPDGAAREPAPVAAIVIAPTPPSSNSDWLSSEQAQNSGLSFSDLAQHVGSRVSIVTAGEHVHNGVISAADARQVTLRVKRAGGQATYALPRKQIVSIALR